MTDFMGKLSHRIRHAARRRALWFRQGRPRDFPVVMKVGTLTVEHPTGASPRYVISGWDLDGKYLRAPFDPSDMTALWLSLSKRYAVDVHRLEQRPR